MLFQDICQLNIFRCLRDMLKCLRDMFRCLRHTLALRQAKCLRDIFRCLGDILCFCLFWWFPPLIFSGKSASSTYVQWKKCFHHFWKKTQNLQDVWETCSCVWKTCGIFRQHVWETCSKVWRTKCLRDMLALFQTTCVRDRLRWHRDILRCLGDILRCLRDILAFVQTNCLANVLGCLRGISCFSLFLVASTTYFQWKKSLSTTSGNPQNLQSVC